MKNSVTPIFGSATPEERSNAESYRLLTNKLIQQLSPLTEEKLSALRECRKKRTTPPLITWSLSPTPCILQSETQEPKPFAAWSLSSAPCILQGEAQEPKVLFNIELKKRLETVLNKQWFTLSDEQMTALREVFKHFEDPDALKISPLQKFVFKASRYPTIEFTQENYDELEFYFDCNMAIVNISSEFFKRNNLARETFAHFLCAFVKTSDKKVLVSPASQVAYPLKELRQKAVFASNGSLQMQFELDMSVTIKLTCESQSFLSNFRM